MMGAHTRPATRISAALAPRHALKLGPTRSADRGPAASQPLDPSIAETRRAQTGAPPPRFI
eukprot:366465-Chlamydomonas_euryale.AAC.16